MHIPEVRYVTTDDDVRIAYMDFGSGPPTVFITTVLGHLEGYWAFDRIAKLFERVAANVRVLMFDHRGNGMSDGFIEPPTLQDRTLDVKAVLDDVAIEEVNVIGFDFGAQLAAAFAAEYPERVNRLVLANARVGASARARADELFPGFEEIVNAPVRSVEQVGIEAGQGWTFYSPSMTKFSEDLEQIPRFERLVGTRDVFERQLQSVSAIDIVPLASRVQAPTLVVHTVGNRLVHIGYARLLAELIQDAQLLELEGPDHMYWYGENWREMIDAQVSFVTGSEIAAPVDRAFAVVLFTDIVGSARATLEAGDTEWSRRLDAHDRITRSVVARHRGTIVNTTGDGFIATFAMPSEALDAAIETRDELQDVGLAIRAGVHAGEVEVRGLDISGAVVNIAARVEQSAQDGEIYTTSAVRDMLVGSLFTFDDAGSHALKGFADPWHLFSVSTRLEM